MLLKLRFCENLKSKGRTFTGPTCALILLKPIFVALIPALAVPETASKDLFFAKLSGIVTGFKTNFASFQATAASAFWLAIKLRQTVTESINSLVKNMSFLYRQESRVLNEIF